MPNDDGRRPELEFLPPAEAEYIARFGGVPDPETGEGGDQYERLVRDQARIDAAAFASIDEVADLLATNSATIGDQLAHERLVAHRTEGMLLFPLWQFTGDNGSTIPHVTEVWGAIRPDMSPAEVAGIMETPQLDLLLDGVPATPKKWLEAGGAVEAVTALLTSDVEW